MKAIDYKAIDLAKDTVLTVNITHVKSWRIRLWIGCKLIRFAALIIGCGVKIKDQGYGRAKNIQR